MLIPIGVPEHANARISKLVKSGFENLSFSNYFPQGSLSISPSALSTKVLNFLEVSLSTIETNPSNSARAPDGSR